MSAGLLLLAMLVRALPASSYDLAWWQAIVSVEQAESHGDCSAALVGIRSAIKSVQYFGPGDLRAALTYSKLGGLYRCTGQLRDSENAYLKSLAIWERVAPNNPRVATVLMELSNVYVFIGETAKAERLGRRAIAIEEHAFGLQDLRLVYPLQSLAIALQSAHRYDEALGLYKRAIDILGHDGHTNVLLVASLRGKLGELLGRMGLLDDAITEARGALDILETVPDQSRFRLAAFRTTLAKLYCLAERWQDAYGPIVKAKDEAYNALGPDHFVLEPILLTYAEVLRHTNRKREAREITRRAKAIRERFEQDNALGAVIDVGGH